MKILVVGSGGREHTIVRKLKESKRGVELFCAPGNAGISMDATCVDIAAKDIDGIVKFSVDNKIELVVVAPDDPLVLGMVDALEAMGIMTFGPNKAAAAIEGSKVFSKDLMKKYNIPTAMYEVFDEYQKAISYVKKQKNYPLVIKADGLALGKGVIIAENFKMAELAIKSIMQDKAFGESGNSIVIEEFLTGPEVSVLAFTDGKTLVPMISSMDHKRAFDDDKGLNTGGMGTIAPNPCYNSAHQKEAMEKIFIPTIKAMEKEGRPFKGCLYFGLMLTPKGVYVIEYNCRFGDPETQVVLPLLKTDLVEIIEHIHREELNKINIEWADDAAACIIMASGGYPSAYEKGLPIMGLDRSGQIDEATVIHAGTKFIENEFCTNGGRVLGVCATGATLKDALSKSYSACKKIKFEGAFYRSDIGKKALKTK